MEDNTEQIKKYHKYLKIFSWIITIIVVILMFVQPYKAGEFDAIIETVDDEKAREKYIEEKYGNMIDELK